MGKISFGKIMLPIFALIALLSLSLPSLYGYELNEKLHISGTLTGVYHLLKMTKSNSPESEAKNKDRGSLVIDFNVSYTPNEQGMFFLRASFAKGDGLKGVASFNLSPNGDDLSGDLKNINGHKRDHLLEMWYRHKLEFQRDVTLRLQAGIIDSGAFIDDNAYSNSEINQFMNTALVNNPIANRPTYDLGAVFEIEWDRFCFRVLGMSTKSEDRRNFKILVTQTGYKLDTALGEGNYRIYAYTTDRKFKSWDQDSNKALRGVGVSFDQQIIKNILGAFFRAGWQDHSVKKDYSSLLSLGVNIKGYLWGRRDDEVGLGYAYLRSSSKNRELKNSQVFEVYTKFLIFTHKTFSSDITIDYQFVRDRASIAQNTKAGNIFGTRLNLNF